MKLKLVLERVDGSEIGLGLTADATATVGDVATALQIGDPYVVADLRPMTLQIVQSAGVTTSYIAALDPDQGLADSGVRSGSTVKVVPAPTIAAATQHSGRGRSRAMLRVVSGVDAGREFLLPEGTSTIGSAATDHVRLTDPGVAPAHAAVVVGESIEVIDHSGLGSVRIGGIPVTRALVSSSNRVELSANVFAIAHISTGGSAGREGTAIEFTRPPRVIARFDARSIKAPEPPGRPEPVRLPVVSMLAPLVLGIVLFAVTRNMLTILFIGLSPLLMIGMYIDSSQQAKKKLRNEIERFAEQLRTVAAELHGLHNIERAVRHSETPSLADTIEAIHLSGPLMWTHRPEHRQFLTVRLGIGDASSRVDIEMPRNDDTLPEYREQVAALHQQYSTISDVPVVADLRSSGSLGVCGPRPLVDGVARGIVLQLVGLHSPAELTMTALVSSNTRPSWGWLEWLPHTGSVHSPISGDHLSDDAAGGAALLSRLDALVRDRVASVDPASRVADHPPVVPVVIVLVENDAPIDRSRATRLAETGPAVGVHVVWVAPQLANVPAACRTYLLTESGTAGSTSGEVLTGNHTFPIASEQVDVAVATQVAFLLAPVVDVGVCVDDQTDLPEQLPFLSLTGDGVAALPDSVLARWQATGSIADRSGAPRTSRTSDATLRAPVGSTGVDTFWLDLREHGPHALVGGTTGAGKSEFLLAWILGMATEHSPDRVTFLFVDYKGGTAFAECAQLPHTVGVVTDLSPHLVQRALVSLRAEVTWREELLNRKRAKDLLALERSGDPDAPPSLVIVVDEFAALAKEVPEFVDGVVDIAQRGRSLGLHLVLATQRPAGVIRENLRANTNLRVALRMADAEDSTDILGSPAAAYFPARVPGRAAAKIGNAAAVSFQSGYTGGRTVGREVAAPIAITELRFGNGAQWDTTRSIAAAAAEDESDASDISRIVETVTLAAAAAAIPEPRKPWLPELSDTYDLLRTGTREPTDRIFLGIGDDARTQSQPPMFFDPDIDGNMAVIGTGGSGKSTVLRTVAVSAMTGNGSGPVEIYGIDCGTAGLRMLDNFPQVGSVVPGDDDERVGRLLRRLVATIDERSERFAAAAATLRDFRAFNPTDAPPRVLLLLDGLTNFRESYETSATSPWYELLLRVATDGRSVGVHVVVTADRYSALPAALGALVQRRLVLRLADPDDYMLAGVPRGVLTAASPPGRGFMSGNEIQVAVVGGSADVGVQASAVSTVVDSFTGAGIGATPAIERLPTVVPLVRLPARTGSRAVIGLHDSDLAPFGITLSGVLMVTGPPGSGRTNALASLAAAVARAEPSTRRILLTPTRSTLARSGTWDSLGVGDTEVATRAADLADLAAEPGGSPLMVVLESVTSFHQGTAEPEILRLIKACSMSGHLVVGEAETSTWGGAYALTPPFKAARRGIGLHPGDLDGDTFFGVALGRRARSALIPGRGYFFERGTATKIQVALADPV